MGSPEFEHAQAFHNSVREYEYVANQSQPGLPPPFAIPTGVPVIPMPVHLACEQSSCLDDAHSPQYAGAHPHPPPMHMPPYAMPYPPCYTPPVYPYHVAPPPWIASAGGPMPSGTKGHQHWLGQSRFDAHRSQMHEAAKKAASAKEATVKWKPDAKADDMFWCMYEDGSSKLLASFATISTFEGKWYRGPYDGIAYFVREKEKDEKS